MRAIPTGVRKDDPHLCPTCSQRIDDVVTAYGRRGLCGCRAVRWTRIDRVKDGQLVVGDWVPEKRQSMHAWVDR